MMRAVEGSLKRFQTDYIDLYQIHRQDLEVHIEETLSAVTDLVRQGKVRYVGLSTHPAWAVMESILLSEFKGYVRIATEQPPYNLLDRRIENELLPMAQKFGLGIITWSPLAMGILAGVYDKEDEYPPDSRAALRGGFYADRVTAKGIEVGKKFSALAKEAGLTSAQLGVLWCKDQPGITAPLIGPETMEHLEDSLPVLEMTLSDELREACDNLVPPGSNVANFHNTAGWMKAQII
jgi:aryl-alcohol dehydrogenase-like predicted oxidoreductase